MDIATLRSLQASLNAHIETYTSEAENGENVAKQKRNDTQLAIYADTMKMMQMSANPQAEIYRLGLQPIVNMAVRIAIDLDLFNIIKDQETLHDIVQRTGAAETLVLRVLRLLIAVGVFHEPETHTYKSTPLSKSLTVPGLRDWIKSCYDFMLPIWQKTPCFVSTNSFQDVADLAHNPTLETYGDNFFDALAKRPALESDFASAMSLAEAVSEDLVPNYPYGETIAEVSSMPDPNSKVFIVDVGGGRGQYISNVMKKYPAMPGQKIVQDLAGPISTIPPNSGFEAMVHNFFEPQPVHGAKFYFLRSILHDWPDKACLEILKQLRPAFREGFSRLLIQSHVLPIDNVSLDDTLIDLNMWILCAKERNETEWHSLLDKAGFKILRIIRPRRGSFAVIEAALDDEEPDKRNASKM